MYELNEVYREIQLPLNLWRVLDLLYPPTCCNCGSIGFELCPRCLKSIKALNNSPVCPTCSLPLTEGKQCDFCTGNQNYFQKLISWGLYQGVLRNIIIKVKYGRGIGLMDYILPPVLECIKQANIDFDLVIPVPLGKSRMRSRGYNQTVLFARPIAKALHKPVPSDALHRTRETRSQVGLNLEERKSNLCGAFKAREGVILKKSILLVDDVATTCSTLNECAKELITAGASNVICFTLARAISMQ